MKIMETAGDLVKTFGAGPKGANARKTLHARDLLAAAAVLASCKEYSALLGGPYQASPGDPRGRRARPWGRTRWREGRARKPR